MKRAEGLSLNVVIIAILALLVLLVVSLIFTGRLALFNKGIDSCAGQCVENTQECADLDGQPQYTGKCREGGGQPDASKPYCCVIQKG